MCDYVADYLSVTGQRDKVMAIVQFLPMALEGPAVSAGNPALAKHLRNLSNMADGYRAITRLSLLFDALGKRTLTALAKPSGDVVSDRLDQLGHFFHTFYCIFENTSVYASHGALPKSLSRLGGCAVTCWFYVLTFGVINNLYALLKKKLTPEEKKQHLVTLLKLSLFWVFSQTCIPKGGPVLLENVSGPLAPLHHILRSIAPRHLELSDSIRGSLGFVASMCDFY